MNTPGERTSSDRFSLVAGGPFHALFSRLGLLTEDGLPRASAAVGLALLAGDAQEGFDRALRHADRRSSARLPEFVTLGLALVISLLTTNFASEVASTSWEGVHLGDVERLSWAGWSVALFSNVVFLFLALRWAWRFLRDPCTGFGRKRSWITRALPSSITRPSRRPG